MRCLYLIPLLISALSARADEPERPMLRAELREAIQAGVTDGVWSSVSIGLIRSNGESRWFIDRNTTVEDSATSQRGRYELDAITTVYTGILLADMATAGIVRLSDSIERFLPDAGHCADPHVCAITLGQLATHHSGLPAIPENLFPRDVTDPFASYSESELVKFLETYTLENSPGHDAGQFLSSAVLGWALGRALGQGYPTALRDRVLRPLGLDRTGIDDDALFPGQHLGVVGRAPHHFSGLAGAGALRSDLTDQMKFLQANLKPGDLSLRPALLLARQAAGDAISATFGLGWQIQWVHSGEQDWPLLWQRGSGGAHASFVGFRSDRQEAVVVLADGTADVSRIGLAILCDAALPPLPAAVKHPAAEQLQDYVGLYQINPRQELIIRASANGLSAQSPGQLAIPLYAIDTDQYVYADAPTQLVFQRQAGRVISALVSQGGINFPVRRLSDGVPVVPRTPIEVSAEALAEAVGTYRAGANTLARIEAPNVGIQIQFTGGPQRILIAYADDRYATTDGEIDIVMRRDSAHAVDALLLTLFGERLLLPRLPHVLPDSTSRGTAKRIDLLPTSGSKGSAKPRDGRDKGTAPARRDDRESKVKH